MSRGQLALFGSEAPGFDESFAMLRRRELGSGAWIEHAPGWLRGHETLFEALLASTRWRSEQREMYDRVVEVPRRYAVFPADGPADPVVWAAQTALSRRYGQAFERVSAALYRDGADSVAFHGDYVARRMDHALVASVSLGAPRRLLLRPAGGGRSIAVSLGWGDLFVMGGTCQRTYQHAVPKVVHADPRIVLMYRPRWTEESPSAQY